MSFETALDAEIGALEKQLAADPKYIKLKELKRVRQLYGAGGNGADAGDTALNRALGTAAVPDPRPSMAGLFSDGKGGWTSAPPTSVENRSGRKPSPERIKALLVAKEFLKGKTNPTKTVDILAYIRDAGVQIGGNDPQNNLSAMLYHSDDFRSHGRAGWTLAGGVFG